MILTAEQLTALRTARPGGDVPPRPRWTAEEIAARKARDAAVKAEFTRIDAICQACRAKLDDLATPEDVAEQIEDCAFVAQCTGERKRQIRDGSATCPMGHFEVRSP